MGSNPVEIKETAGISVYKRANLNARGYIKIQIKTSSLKEKKNRKKERRRNSEETVLRRHISQWRLKWILPQVGKWS
jgi:hypothetical protein